jgi:hypothetical protein
VSLFPVNLPPSGFSLDRSQPVFLLANPLPADKLPLSPMILGKSSLDSGNHWIQTQASETHLPRQDWKINVL